MFLITYLHPSVFHPVVARAATPILLGRVYLRFFLLHFRGNQFCLSLEVQPRIELIFGRNPIKPTWHLTFLSIPDFKRSKSALVKGDRRYILLVSYPIQKKDVS